MRTVQMSKKPQMIPFLDRRGNWVQKY
jgi:hypothetical protein